MEWFDERNYKLRATNYEIRDTRVKIRIISYEVKITRYVITDTRLELLVSERHGMKWSGLTRGIIHKFRSIFAY